MNIWKIENSKMFFEQVLEINEVVLKKYIELSEKEKYYNKIINIPKKNGTRKIYTVDKNHVLFRLQKRICENFLNNIIISDVSYGFKKGFNYIEYLIPHTNFYKRNNYLRIDIKDFFGSITIDNLKDTLGYYFIISETLTEVEKEKLLNYTVEILTFNNTVIQGAPSSPTVSNIIFRSLDIRIERYCNCYSINYTRYADDMLFSSEDKNIYNDVFLSGITRILDSKKFFINYDKIIRSREFISLSGYVISDSIRLSRSKLSDLNRILFYVENHNINNPNYFSDLKLLVDTQNKSKHKDIDGIYKLINYLAGYRSFIIGSVKYSSDIKFVQKSERLLKRIEYVIINLSK